MLIIAALLTTAKLWNQPRCHQLMKGCRQCGISATKKNGIMLVAGKQMKLEIIMLSEISQTVAYSLSYAESRP
jgi:hypothetical protein